MNKQTNIHIRIPQAGDGAGLAHTWFDTAKYYVELNPELFQLPDMDGLAQWCEEWAVTQPSEDTFLRVAEHNDQVIGFIGAAIQLPMTDGHRQFVRDMNVKRLMIDALVVQQVYWRHGVGRQLMKAAEQWGRSQGAVIALLDTYISSPVSVSFYEQQMGYQRRALHFRKVLA
ncbi:MAG TPA: GNAT family N-acetyltransferase [Anaerolineales bacterium]|nr:GNAT family N-acetyltransferase [Anaerolineales bacterium]